MTNEATSFDARIGGVGPEPSQPELERRGTGESIGVGIAAVMSTVNFNVACDTLVNPHGRPLTRFHSGPLDHSAGQRTGDASESTTLRTSGRRAIYTAGTTGASGVWRDSPVFP